mmetsp:Transcript_1551/g.3241  ORF Transcript_1551/g.3241 Transcript_1551/m.3241 type:complete len:146 (-) Transcript_1551:466-903(-)
MCAYIRKKQKKQKQKKEREKAPATPPNQVQKERLMGHKKERMEGARGAGNNVEGRPCITAKQVRSFSLRQEGRADGSRCFVLFFLCCAVFALLQRRRGKEDRGTQAFFFILRKEEVSESGQKTKKYRSKVFAFVISLLVQLSRAV